MLKMWRNKDTGEVVQAILENNFKILGKHLSQNILCLSTSERELLANEYLSKGLRIYDTTLNKWFMYDGEKWTTAFSYNKKITLSDWNNNVINIPFSIHLIPSPIVQLSIKINNVYHVVSDGVIVDDDNNITLTTDTPFEGRVDIK